MRILDCGAWGGKKVKELLDEGHDAYGADIDTSRFLPEIKERLFKLDITKPLPNLQQLNKKFDMIYFEEVLEHLDEGKDEIALKNINQLLNQNGTLILTTPKSIPYMEDWDPAWVRWKLGLGPRHYHYSIEELFTKLDKAGFEIKKVRLNGGVWWLFCRWFNLILKHIFRLNDNYRLQSMKRKGYFDLEVKAIKK